MWQDGGGREGRREGGGILGQVEWVGELPPMG